MTATAWDTIAAAGTIDTVRTFRAMASWITLRVVEPGPDADAGLERAAAIVRDVERTCSRFDPTSALTRANAEPAGWHDAPATFAAAITAAERAYRSTGGLFDPRILDTLLDWGYDRSLPFADGGVERAGPHGGATAPRAHATPWRPQVAAHRGGWRVRLGGHPIDLGGIGKGLAVRWAAAELAGAGRGYLVEAGGDCAFGGVGPDGGRWPVGVEDPAGGAEPILVLDLTDTGCATSSIRRRRWLVDGQPVHHLVDPRTRRPGGDGLAAVTVVAPDPAWSEVWSKTLFLAGARHIRARADELGLAAAWVDLDGAVTTTATLDPMVIWSAHV